MPLFLTLIKTRFQHLPRFVRTLVYLMIAYGCYAGLFGLITPLILQSQIPKKLSERLGRPVYIGQIHINPFILQAKIDNFSIKGSHQRPDLISFQKLDIEFDMWRSVFTLTPSLAHVYLNQPHINIERLTAKNKTDQFNFSDIIQRITDTNPSKSANQSSSVNIPSIKITQTKITQGQISFNDQLNGAKLIYRNIDLHLAHLDTQALLPIHTPNSKQKTINHYTLKFTGPQNGQLKLTGTFQLNPVITNGQLNINQLALTPLWPFAAHYFKARLTDGRLNLKTKFALHQENGQFNVTTQQGGISLDQLIFNDQTQPKVKLDSLRLNNISVNSKTRTAEIQSLSTHNLWLESTLSKKGLQLQTLFTPKLNNHSSQHLTQSITDNEPISPTKTSSQSPWILKLGHIQFKNSDIRINDQLIGKNVHWQFYPLTLSVNSLSSQFKQPVHYHLGFKVQVDSHQQAIPAGNEFQSDGLIDIKSGTIHSNIKLTDLNLNQFQPYLKPYLNIQLENGLLSSHGNISVNSHHKASYQGQISLNKLLITDKANHQPLLKWQRMFVDSIHWDQQKNSLNIHHILLEKPYTKIIIYKNHYTNIGQIEVQTKPDSTKQSDMPTKSPLKTRNNHHQKTEQPLAIQIDQIGIKDGSAYFADHSITPRFSAGIESLNGAIRHLSSSPESKAFINLKGAINQYSPVTLKGELNPFIHKPYLNLNLNFDNVELVSVNPYSGTYAGYYIDKGQLSLNLNYSLKNNQLKGNNHIVIHQLKLGKPSDSKQAISLPVKLAIALLQNRHGVIDLGIPVTGDLNDPNFSFGGIIWTAFKNIITKAVTAPFSFLANLVGSHQKLDHIAFPPGGAFLTSNEQNKLNTLAKALDQRPKLKLSIRGSVNATTDALALSERRLQQALLKGSGLKQLPAELSASRFPMNGPLAQALETQFLQRTKANLVQERANIRKQLEAKAKTGEVTSAQVTTVLHIGMYNELLKDYPVSHEALAQLAQKRANAIKVYLVDQSHIAANRVFLLNSTTRLQTHKAGAKLILDSH
ncbi:MAG: hypothetical protein CENE_02340 [Candidatus Celerinatantimonas neptuna]|nr:MAG: hypothetical protein CENE_02340 [Candidatus Celerinatantimonas neptuna]